MGYFYSDEELAHHGILGQKWGVRRFQNPDGSLTAEGRKRNQLKEQKLIRKTQTSSYSSSFERANTLYQKNKNIQTRSKELDSLEKEVKDLFDKKESFEENDQIIDAAYKRATELARKDPSYSEFGKKYEEELIDWYMYDGNVFRDTAKEVLKDNKEYKEIKDQYNKKIKEYKQTCSEITNEIIGDMGNEKINGLGTDMNYRELVHYALSKPHLMWMLTYEEDMGRK